MEQPEGFALLHQVRVVDLKQYFVGQEDKLWD